MNQDNYISQLVEKISSDIKKHADSSTPYFTDIKEATTIDEAIRFKIRNPKNLIYYGELFLCDIHGSEMNLCRLSEKLVKIDGRGKLPVQVLATVADKETLNKFNRWNGVWSIDKYLNNLTNPQNERT